MDSDLCECDRPDKADDPHRHERDAACHRWRGLRVQERRLAAACVFCQIATYDPRDQVIRRYEDRWVVVFAPLNPVTPGHLLIVPRAHVPDAAYTPSITAEVFGAAAREADRLNDACNLITSKGAIATQTVMHLHVHLVPRREGDGLHLPWTGQAEREARRAEYAAGIIPIGGQ